MPLTDYQKRLVLQKFGFNPEEYDVDEATESIVSKIPKEQPVISQPSTETLTNQPTTAPPIDKYSVGQTLWENIKESAFPTSVGAATFPLATKGIMAVAPRIHPLWGTLGGILATIGTTALASKGQQTIEEKLMGEEAFRKRQEMLGQMGEEHPIAGFAGQVAPMLAYGTPDPYVLSTAGKALITKAPRAIGQYLSRGGLKETPAAFSPIEAAALKNVFGGAGIQMGFPVAESLMRGELPSIPDLIESAILGGTMMGRPTKLGQKLFGWKRMPTKEEYKKTFQPRAVPEIPAETPVPKAEITPEHPLAGLISDYNKMYLDTMKEVRRQNELNKQLGREALTPEQVKEKTERIVQTEKIPEEMAKRKQTEFDIAEADRIAGQPFSIVRSIDEKGKPEYVRSFEDVKRTVKEMVKTGRFNIDLLESHKIRPNAPDIGEQIVRLPEETVRQLLDQQLYPREYAELKQAEIDKLSMENQRKQEFEKQRQKILALNKESNYQMFKRLKLEGNEAEATKFVGKDLAEFQAKYALEGGDINAQVQRKEEKITTPIVAEETKPPQPQEIPSIPKTQVTAEETRKLWRRGEEVLGGTGVEKYQFPKEVESTKVKGEKIAGLSIAPGKVAISQAKAGADTLIHEALHQDKLRVEQSGSKSQRALWKRAEDILSSAPEWEETIVQPAGSRATKIELARSRKEWGNRLKYWYQDLMSSMRYAGRRDTATDIQNLLGRRIIDDPNYYESGMAARDLARVVKGSSLEEKTQLKTQKESELKVGKQELPLEKIPDWNSEENLRDKQEHTRIQEEWVKLLKAGKAPDSSEVIELFKQNELLKDKYNGYTPFTPKEKMSMGVREQPESELYEVPEEWEGKDYGREIAGKLQKSSFDYNKYAKILQKRFEKLPEDTRELLTNNIVNPIIKELEKKFAIKYHKDEIDSAINFVLDSLDDKLLKIDIGKETRNKLEDLLGSEYINEKAQEYEELMSKTLDFQQDLLRKKREAEIKAEQKTEELEAFTRPDQERQQG